MSNDEITMRDLMEASLRAIDINMFGIREQLNAFQQASAREHAEVRADLAELRTGLTRVPSDAEFDRYKQDVDGRLIPLERDLNERTGGLRARASVWGFVVGGAAVLGTMLGAVLAFARVLLP